MLCAQVKDLLLVAKHLGLKTLPFTFKTTLSSNICATLWLYTVSVWRNPCCLGGLAEL